MIVKFLKRLFGSRNDRVIRRLNKTVKKINLFESDFKLLNEIDFPNKTQFEGLISEFLNLNEVAKNWIRAQEKINSDKSLRFLKTHNMFGKYD